MVGLTPLGQHNDSAVEEDNGQHSNNGDADEEQLHLHLALAALQFSGPMHAGAVHLARGKEITLISIYTNHTAAYYILHVEADLAIVVLLQILVEVVHVNVVEHAGGAFILLMIDQAVIEFCGKFRKVPQRLLIIDEAIYSVEKRER